MKKDAKNAANAAQNPGSFETKTQIPPEEGYDFSYHNLVCPLADFAKQYGYEEYMPYLCNLDYVMFGLLGVPLFREHTCFEDGDFCDFKIKIGEKPMEYWPPVYAAADLELQDAVVVDLLGGGEVPLDEAAPKRLDEGRPGRCALPQRRDRAAVGQAAASGPGAPREQEPQVVMAKFQGDPGVPALGLVDAPGQPAG